MIDQLAVRQALRDLALAVQVCTTGSVTLSATSAGYARSDGGSFITDGFHPGMESLGAGFGAAANNTRKTVTAVTATLLTMRGGCSAESAGAGRSLTVGLPAMRLFQNLPMTDNGQPVSGPEQGRPYIEEEFVPATNTLLTTKQNGTNEETGLYLLRLFYPANTGDMAILRQAQELIEIFEPGLPVTISAGALNVRGNPGPWSGQVRNDRPGWCNLIVTIPWRAISSN